MKKTNFILIVSASLLFSCRNSNNNNPQNNFPAARADTSSMHVTPPPADTSIKDGMVTLRYKTGVIKEKSYYVNGRRNGECISFYESGRMCSDDYFTNGLIDGSSTTYYDNGQKRYEGTFVKGKPAGKWSFWDDKGKLIRTVDYGAGTKKPI